MLFSFWNFKDYFFERNIDFIYNIVDDTPSVSRITLINSRHELKEGCAGVCEGILLRYPEYQSCLVNEKNWIKFPTSSPQEIMDLLTEMELRFADWESGILDAILQDAPLTDLLDLAASYLPLSLTFYPLSDKKAVHSSNTIMPLSRADLNLLAEDLSKKTAFPVFRRLKPTDFNSYVILALENSGERVGYFIASGRQGNISAGTLSFLTYFANLTVHYLKVHSDSYSSEILLEDFFKHAISDRHINETKLLTLQEGAGWPAGRYYTIYTIQSDTHNNYSVTDNIIQSIKKNLHHHCCFYYEGEIICIIYSDLKDVQFLSAKIKELVPSAHYFVGQSLPTQEITMFRQYFLQSKKALSRALKNKEHFVSAAAMIPDLVAEDFRTNAWVQSLVHPDLQLLAAYDTQNHDDLLDTLYVYLILGKSNILTAQALFIHRNTLRSRINKIKNLIRADLDSQKDCMQLLSSFFVYAKLRPPA